MKKLKFICAALFITVLTANVSAQETRAVKQVEQSSEQKAMLKTRKMTVNLKLTTEQSEKVADLNNTFAVKYDDLKATGKTDAVIKAELLPSYEEKLKPILTEEQWKLYEALKAEKAE